MLGGLSADIQAHNPLSHQVTELLMQFGLVDFQQHINSNGSFDTVNMVSEAGWQILGIKLVRLRHGGNKGREEVYGARRPVG